MFSICPRPRASRRLLGFTAALTLCFAALSSTPAAAYNKYLEIPPDSVVKDSRAYTYANMSNAEAFSELARRKISYERVPEKVWGVRAPIRLAGPINGVYIHSVLPEEERAETPFEILDARLALALYDLCHILRSHDVVEIVHFTLYRPPAKLREDPNNAQTRHPGGLAIDLGAMKKANGDWLAVGPHWSSSIGSKTCGTGARKLPLRRGRELMSILCEVYDQRIFHYMLSPHYNTAHADHFHLEIKPGVKWFLVN